MIRPVLLFAAALALAGVSLGHAQQPAAATSPADKPQAASQKPTDEELRKRLTPEQYRVTRESDTEPAFHNAYWDNHLPGIYVDVISGKPLFSSLDKFESGTGWPSFTKPLVKENVWVRTDPSYGMERDEVKGKDSDAHLGHVFDDGPADKGGKRYCMNSAALRFVPADQLQAEGYSQFLALFAKESKAEKK